MLMSVPAVWAGVRVEIVDHPAKVLQWSPVLITAQIANDGPETVLVSVGRRDNYFVETGPVGGELVGRIDLTGTTGTHPVKKLQPGDTWLFQFDVRKWMSDPGHYQARVGFRGKGYCFLKKAVAEELGAMPSMEGRRSSGHKRPQPYECWEGQVFSQEVSVQVDEPTRTVDREALKYIESSDYPVPVGGFYRVMHGSRYLKERFPDSHYTYVSVFYGSRDFDWLLRVQPDHPLTPYTKLKAVLKRSQEAEWCSESAAVYAAELKLPHSLEQYALQTVLEMRVSE